jgi:hypothetical protein
MIAVRVVQPAVHEIVEMVTMRHRFVPAVWTVDVGAVDLRRTVHGICSINGDDMFVHVILVHVVEMAVVKIIHMAVMANRSVSAVRAMLVGVVGMMLLGAGRHDRVLPSFRTLSEPLVTESLQRRNCPQFSSTYRRSIIRKMEADDEFDKPLEQVVQSEFPMQLHPGPANRLV